MPYFSVDPIYEIENTEAGSGHASCNVSVRRSWSLITASVNHSLLICDKN